MTRLKLGARYENSPTSGLSWFLVARGGIWPEPRMSDPIKSQRLVTGRCENGGSGRNWTTDTRIFRTFVNKNTLFWSVFLIKCVMCYTLCYLTVPYTKHFVVRLCHRKSLLWRVANSRAWTVPSAEPFVPSAPSDAASQPWVSAWLDQRHFWEHWCELGLLSVAFEVRSLLSTCCIY